MIRIGTTITSSSNFASIHSSNCKNDSMYTCYSNSKHIIDVNTCKSLNINRSINHHTKSQADTLIKGNDKPNIRNKMCRNYDKDKSMSKSKSNKYPHDRENTNIELADSSQDELVSIETVTLPRRKNSKMQQMIQRLRKNASSFSSKRERSKQGLVLESFQDLRISTEVLLSPQNVLDSLLLSHGYSAKQYPSIKSDYFKEPTLYQKSCYHPRLREVIRTEDTEALHLLFKAGLSPNAYDVTTGTYLIHMISETCSQKLLQVILEYGGGAEVLRRADQFGRTPLHMVCMNADVGPMTCSDLSANLNAVLTTILEVDKQLLQMTDCREAGPLAYVRKEHYNEWISFIKMNENKFWPVIDGSSAINNTATSESLILDATGEQPSRLITSGREGRRNGLTIEMATLLASGKIQPDEVCLFQYDHHCIDWNDDEDEVHHDEHNDTNDQIIEKESEEKSIQPFFKATNENGDDQMTIATTSGMLSRDSCSMFSTLSIDIDDDDEDDTEIDNTSISFDEAEMLEILNSYQI